MNKFKYLGSEIRNGKNILKFEHPGVTDSDPTENRLQTHNDWRTLKDANGGDLPVSVPYRVADTTVEIDVTAIPQLAKGKKFTGYMTVKSVDGTEAKLPLELLGPENNKAQITVSSPLLFKESQRGPFDITEQVKVSDIDEGEARLMLQAEESLTLIDSKNRPVAGGEVLFGIDADGKAKLTIKSMPPLKGNEILKAHVYVKSQDGTDDKFVELKFEGENDKAKIDGGTFVFHQSSDHEQLSRHLSS